MESEKKRTGKVEEKGKRRGLWEEKWEGGEKREKGMGR